MRLPHALFATWDASSPSRRRWIVVLAFVVAAAALLSAVRPLTVAIARSESDVARTRSMLDVAEVRIADNESLARVTPAVHAGDLRAAIERVMARYEVRAAPVASATTVGRYAVVVDDARFDVIVAALDALARDEGVYVAVATLTARVEPGRVRADLTLTR